MMTDRVMYSFQATYEGVCPTCMYEIKVNDWCAKLDGGDVVHDRCVQ